MRLWIIIGLVIFLTFLTAKLEVFEAIVGHFYGRLGFIFGIEKKMI